MKKSVILLFSLVLMLVFMSFFVSAQETNCTDTDGGRNYEIKGTTTNNSETQADSCNYCTGACPEGNTACQSTCGAVEEFYCDGNAVKTETHVCGNSKICENGACINQTTSITCTDYDGEDYYNSSYIREAATGWGTTVDTCPNSTFVEERVCVSGHGANKYFKCPNGYACNIGACIISNATISNETGCETFQVSSERIHSNLNGVTGSQFCSDTNKFCSQVYAKHETVTENSAQDGYFSCDVLHGPENIDILRVTCCGSPVPCSDTDGGKNYYVKGQTTQNGVLSGVDQCEIHHNGSIDIVSSCDGSNCLLAETFCSPYAGSSPSGETYSCPNGCSHGACVSSSNETLCTDSDGGMNIYTKGYAIGSRDYNPYNQTMFINDSCFERLSSGGGREVQSCSGSNCAQEEAVCNENGPATYSPEGIGNPCPNGCSNGACVSEGVLTPTNETGPIEIPSNGTISCSGCQLENKCYPFGYRKSGKYCTENNEFISQLESGACANNFECSSNVCVNDECVGKSLIQRIIDWFKSLFGA